MPAEVLSLAQARLTRAAESTAARRTRVPVALQAHPGAVELGVGAPDDVVELWLTADDALELADDLRRTALAAKGAR